MVIDDHSTDRTREIATQFPDAIVIDSGPLPPGWTGKANALWTAAGQMRGEWLLFTDADTVHELGSLERAIREAEDNKAKMLSYSPRQVVRGFWQHALMPLVFAELAMTYPPAKVSDPRSRVAAANGQFLMMHRDAYFAVGGHSAVGSSVLEDVDLAFLLKRKKYSIRFRYAPDALSTRMYRTTPAMIEGWTKNLARLFPRPIVLAAWRMIDWMLVIVLPLLVVGLARTPWACLALVAVWLRASWRFYARVRRSNFARADCILSFAALPVFCFLLMRSWFHHRLRRSVLWKGREYSIPKN